MQFEMNFRFLFVLSQWTFEGAAFICPKIEACQLPARAAVKNLKFITSTFLQ